MITHLRGKIEEIYPSHVVVDCNGVGYWVNISLSTYAAIEKEESILIFTYHLVREDNEALYGFATKAEREVFERLLSVNGVGPSSAIMMLSTLSPEELSNAILTEDVKTLQSVKGIGAKTAQRIILDLRDKLVKAEDSEILTVVKENKIKFEALSALEILGISKKQAEKHVQKLLKENPSLSLEEVIKQTLKKI